MIAAMKKILASKDALLQVRVTSVDLKRWKQFAKKHGLTLTGLTITALKQIEEHLS